LKVEKLLLWILLLIVGVFRWALGWDSVNYKWVKCGTLISGYSSFVNYIGGGWLSKLSSIHLSSVFFVIVTWDFGWVYCFLVWPQFFWLLIYDFNYFNFYYFANKKLFIFLLFCYCCGIGGFLLSFNTAYLCKVFEKSATLGFLYYVIFNDSYAL